MGKKEKKPLSGIASGRRKNRMLRRETHLVSPFRRGNSFHQKEGENSYPVVKQRKSEKSRTSMLVIHIGKEGGWGEEKVIPTVICW